MSLFQSPQCVTPTQVTPTPCPVTPTPLQPLTSTPTVEVPNGPVTLIKVPVVTSVPTIQIPIEATIPLGAAATEIKSVKKSVFLEQVKLVPTSFCNITGTDFFEVLTAKLFVAGHIRKDIQFTTAPVAGVCTVALTDRVANINFTGFTELTFGTANRPIVGISETAEANFLNETNPLVPRLDKFFFQNLVKFNEQPFGELVAANFFELDFSPMITTPEGTFDTITEKLVLELTLKVLQIQQVTLVGSTSVVPVFGALTPPSTTPSCTI